ncbi:MAG: CDGSH iron-sulfur domain-containing protein [Planctomycetota bacterium]
MTPIKVVFDEPRTVVWCACGKSRNAPYCDGTHSSLG